jgi:hypothetical protein
VLFSALNQEPEAEERGIKLIRANRTIIRKINNFIPDLLIELESDMNIKPYKPLAFSPVIGVEYKIPLIKNAVIVCSKYLEGMSCSAYFPSERKVRFWLNSEVLFGE